MPEYIDPQVEDLRGSNNPIAVTLLIGVSGDYDNATVCKLVEQAGGTVDAEIGRATLRVTAPETATKSRGHSGKRLSQSFTRQRSRSSIASSSPW